MEFLNILSKITDIKSFIIILMILLENELNNLSFLFNNK